MSAETASSEGVARSEEPARVLSVREVLARRKRGFAIGTLLVGVGVLTLPCMFMGGIPLWFGSRALLAHAADANGMKRSGSGLVGGAIALILAAAIGVAGLPAMTFPFLPTFSPGLAAVAVAAAGAALSPLALAPVASVCGDRGFWDSIVRGIDVAGSDRPWILAPLCSVVAVGLVLPIYFVLRGVIGVAVGSVEMMAVGAAALVLWIVAVPLSATILTARYLRLERARDAPSRIARAVTPFLGAITSGAILFGGIVLAGASQAAHLRAGSDHAIANGTEVGFEAWLDAPTTWTRPEGSNLELTLSPFSDELRVRVDGAHRPPVRMSTGAAESAPAPRPRLRTVARSSTACRGAAGSCAVFWDRTARRFPYPTGTGSARDCRGSA